MKPLKQITADAERRAIVSTLKVTGYNKRQTSKALNIDRKTLYNKMKELGIPLKAKDKCTML